jgi:hypothetical protein
MPTETEMEKNLTSLKSKPSSYLDCTQKIYLYSERKYPSPYAPVQFQMMMLETSGVILDFLISKRRPYSLIS